MKQARQPQSKSSFAYPKDWDSYLYDSTLTLAITPPYAGWIDLVFLGVSRGATFEVRCSNVFDPIPNLIRWIHKIADGALPAQVKVDEEGDYALLQALRVPRRPDGMELRMSRTTYSGEIIDRVPRFHARIERRQFVHEFCRRFESWLREDYRVSEWSAGLRKTDLRTLKRFGRRTSGRRA